MRKRQETDANMHIIWQTDISSWVSRKISKQRTTGWTVSENNIKDLTLSYPIQLCYHGSNDQTNGEIGRLYIWRAKIVDSEKLNYMKTVVSQLRWGEYGCWRGRMLASPVVMQSFSLNRRLALACAATKMHRLQKGIRFRKTIKAKNYGLLSLNTPYLSSQPLTTHHSVHRTPSISSTNRTKPKQRATITITRQRSDG